MCKPCKAALKKYSSGGFADSTFINNRPTVKYQDRGLTDTKSDQLTWADSGGLSTADLLKYFETNTSGGLEGVQATQTSFDTANSNLTSEQARVKQVRAQIANTAEGHTNNPNYQTRASLSDIPEKDRWFCNTHTCEILGDAGATVGEEGIYNLYPSKSRPEGRDYPAGSRFPLIPGNSTMDRYIDDAGFDYVTNPQRGDLIREQTIPSGETSIRTGHSMIYGGDREDGTPIMYGSGNRGGYNADRKFWDTGVKGYEYLRYVGDTAAVQNTADSASRQVQMARWLQQQDSNRVVPMEGRPATQIETSYPEPTIKTPYKEIPEFTSQLSTSNNRS